MKGVKIGFYMTIILSLLAINVLAQDGTLDSAYGVGGILQTNIEATKIIEQKMLSDNSMLILAYADSLIDVQDEMYIRKYFITKVTEDGEIDISFGENGILRLSDSIAEDSTKFSYSTFDVLHNGKFLVLENTEKKRRITPDSTYLKSNSNLIRFNDNGEIDETFGNSGYLNIYSFEGTYTAYDFNPITILYFCVVNSNNTITLFGQTEGQYELLQINNDGSFNQAFGNNGIQRIDYTPGDVKGLKVDAYHNIYVIFNDFEDHSFEILKFNDRGVKSLDYGSSGDYKFIYNSSGFAVQDMDLNKNNSMFILVDTEDDSYSRIALIAKVKSTGIIDSSFGINGIKIFQLSDYENEEHPFRPNEILLMPDGEIVLNGVKLKTTTDFYLTESSLYLAKLKTDGSRSLNFGTGGITFISSIIDTESTVSYLYPIGHAKRHKLSMTDSLKIITSSIKSNELYLARFNNSRSFSSEHHSGNVSGVWDADTVYIDGDISIPRDSSLTINPGTNVYFTGEYKFDVYGTLIANGTEADSIFFFSDSLREISTYPYFAGFWYGITFHSTDENVQITSSLDYCNIKYAFPTWLDEMSGRYGGGLVFYKSQVNVSNTSFTDCIEEDLRGGVFSAIYSSGNVSGISFTKTISPYRAGTMTLINSDVNVENLYMNDAYGLYIDSSTVSIKNSVIENCSPYSQWGFVNSVNSEVELSGCEISNNNGIGVFAKFSSFVIKHTKVSNNTEEGGIFIESPSTFANCEILENGSTGLRFQSSQNWQTTFTSDLQNCVIAKNNGRGIYFLSNNNANIVNCTIADNNYSNGWGGIQTGDAPIYVTNSIVWNNGSDLDFQAGGLYTYSIIQGNYVGSDTATTNMQNVDPLFRDAGNGDYHLQSVDCGYAFNSPGIDAGHPAINDFVLDCPSAGLGTIASDIGAYGGEGNRWDETVLPSCHFRGEVSGIWDCEEIYVDGDITIPEGDTLIISQNVNKVVFSGEYQIKVEGVLLATGKERNGVALLDTNYIKFVGDNWKGILFNNLNNSEVGKSIIENCRFDFANKMDMTYQGGGAIAIYNSDNVEIKHSAFYANSAKFGGAMYIENSNPHIEDCYFELNGKEIGEGGNINATAGGGLYIKNSAPYLRKLQFINNYSITGGGAIVVDNSSLTISNILLAENETQGLGGAIEIVADPVGSLLKVVNMTSTKNVSTENGGGTFHIHGANTGLEVINSIMYDNTGAELFIEGLNPSIAYTTIENGVNEPYFGEGCLDSDPLLLADNGYRLSTATLGYSPAIDAGHPDSLDAVLSEDEGLGTRRADMGFYGGRYSEMPVGVSEGNDNQIPLKYELSQNYPNPFNPTTNITYVIARSEATRQSHELSVQLTVYDVLGREVATLVNAKQTPGKYSVQFDANHLSSGVYFYTLRAGNFVQTRKMVLMR